MGGKAALNTVYCAVYIHSYGVIREDVAATSNNLLIDRFHEFNIHFNIDLINEILKE